jgi:hypothetical protein
MPPRNRPDLPGLCRNCSPARRRTDPVLKSIPEIIIELRAMPVSDLVVQYETAFGKPPRNKNREWLWRKVAWKVQEQRYGGLSSLATKRLNELVAEMDLPLTAPRKATGIITGTTLTRSYRGELIEAKRVDNGWAYEGVIYRSLSAVANAVTGSHCNGRAFFGLSKKR